MRREILVMISFCILLIIGNKVESYFQLPAIQLPLTRAENRRSVAVKALTNSPANTIAGAVIVLDDRVTSGSMQRVRAYGLIVSLARDFMTTPTAMTMMSIKAQDIYDVSDLAMKTALIESALGHTRIGLRIARDRAQDAVDEIDDLLTTSTLTLEGIR